MKGVVISRPMRIASALCLALVACDKPNPSANGPLSAAAVAGCYQFTHSDGRPIRSPSGFWSAPVRLDTALALGDGDDSSIREPGVFAVAPTGPIVEPIDTALMRSTWQILPPDTLLVSRSTGFAGQDMRLNRSAEGFAGVEIWGSDVVDTTPPTEDSVVARRVSCPAPIG